MKRIILVAAMVVLLSSGALAQDEPSSSMASRSGYLSVGGAAGMMIDPDMIGGLISLDYYVTDDIAVGPYLHLGGSSDNSYWGMSGEVKFSAALADNSVIRPYGRIGVGFVELNFKDREKDPSYTYFFPVGGGLEFELTDAVSVDVGASFDITEDTFAGLQLGVRYLL